MFQLCACHSDIPQYNSSETFRNVPLLLSHVCLCAVRFDGYEWLGPAVDRNFSVWGYALDKDMISPAERNPHSHTEAVAQMKRFCTERGAWMDENIDILRQYSHESKNKKFNH